MRNDAEYEIVCDVILVANLDMEEHQRNQITPHGWNGMR